MVFPLKFEIPMRLVLDSFTIVSFVVLDLLPS